MKNFSDKLDNSFDHVNGRIRVIDGDRKNKKISLQTLLNEIRGVVMSDETLIADISSYTVSTPLSIAKKVFVYADGRMLRQDTEYQLNGQVLNFSEGLTAGTWLHIEVYSSMLETNIFEKTINNQTSTVTCSFTPNGNYRLLIDGVLRQKNQDFTQIQNVFTFNDPLTEGSWVRIEQL